MVYSAVKGLKIGKAAPECAVCLSEFHDGETLRFIPKCDHVFHPECIDAWLESHATCPVCRASFAPRDGSTAVEPETIAPASASDLEAGRVDGGTLSEPADGGCRRSEERPPEEAPPEVFWFDRFLNRNHESRSHSAGHSLVQPGGTPIGFALR
ncbi:unnamed protein product [Linum tenue]|nr:unnamed protein product [Linum tenue]